MDLFSRKIIGWSVSKRITTDLVKCSLKKAVKSRNPLAGLLFHSDQGVQYASNEVREYLADNEIVASMSRK
jgi:putative transposase